MPDALAAFPRAPLSRTDRAALERLNWTCLPLEVVVAVAECWNAGVDTGRMARALACHQGTLTFVVARLKQAGLQMRRAGHIKPIRRSPAAERLAKEQMARLRAQAAAGDGSARRLLQIYGAEHV